jgi:hypothetical protein
LYCGLALVAVIGIMLNPFVNRVIRKLDAIHLLHARHSGGGSNNRAGVIATPAVAVEASGDNPAHAGHFRLGEPLPSSHPIYSTGYVIGCLASTVNPKPGIRLTSTQIT